MSRGVVARFPGSLLAVLAVAALMLGAAPVMAQDAGTSSQQQRMKDCNAGASARTLKGDARKTYMSACLAGKADQPTMMKVCNEQATQDKLSSDQRKTYVNHCLKKSG